MDGVSELAKMFKDRDPIKYMGPVVGTVLSPPPEIKIQADKDIILDKSHLVIGASILKDYQREYTTSSDRSSWSDMRYVRLVDTLKEGDEVILIPSQDEQTYFLVDKAVIL